MRNWIWALLTAFAFSSYAAAQTEPAVPAILTDYVWQLREMRDSQGQPDPSWTSPPPYTVGLSFARNGGLGIDINPACNAHGASYRVEGQTLQIHSFVSTLRYCEEPALRMIDETVIGRLGQANHWAISASTSSVPGPVLTLSFANKGQWLLEGEPINVSDGPAEIIFLEVAPQRATCSHPLIPQYQCLQVRRIEYDNQGRKINIGAWENFYSEIQGYQHHAGIRNVLRIKRYQRANAPADASAYVYVLDLTVESQIPD